MAGQWYSTACGHANGEEKEEQEEE